MFPISTYVLCGHFIYLIVEIYKSQIHECGNWDTEHYNSVLEITRSLNFISGNTYYKAEPNIYIKFSCTGPSFAVCTPVWCQVGQKYLPVSLSNSTLLSLWYKHEWMSPEESEWDKSFLSSSFFAPTRREGRGSREEGVSAIVRNDFCPFFVLFFVVELKKMPYFVHFTEVFCYFPSVVNF